MKRTFTLLLCFLFILTKNLCAQLVPGDIAIIQYNSSTSDQFKFLTLVDISGSEEIRFTDNGWLNTGRLRGGEGTITWTAPLTGVPCGTIITIDASSTSSTSHGGVSGSLGVSGSGDQILAYQGTSTAPTFIFAINNDGAAGTWQTNATSSNTSALPTGLTDGASALALAETDHAKYNGPTSGTRSLLLAAICNNANWIRNNSTFQTYSGAFVVSDCAPVVCTEPTVQTSGFTATGITGGATLNWTNGDGARRIIIAREAVAVSATPADGNSYTANTVFAAGTAIAANQFVVYDGNGTSTTVTGLAASTNYHFTIFEYNCLGGNEDFLTSSSTGNVTDVTTPTTPVPSILSPGDLAIIGFDNRSPGDIHAVHDKLSIVLLSEINSGTSFYIANMVYEMFALPNQRTDRWYSCVTSSSGALAAQLVTYNGTATLPAGTILCLKIPNSGSITDFSINGTTSTDFTATGSASINLSSSNPDALFIMQGTWTARTGYQEFSGNVLAGLQDGGDWYDFSDDLSSIPSGAGRRRSRIPAQIECFALQGRTSTGNSFASYTGPTSGAHASILSNILDFTGNWVSGAGTNTDDIPTICNTPFTVTGSVADGVWTGNKNTDWFDCSNWESLTVPDTSTNVWINGANSVRLCEIDRNSLKAPAHNFIAQSKDMTVNNQTLRLIDGTDELHVHGDILLESGTALLDMNTVGTNGTVFLHGDWDNQDNNNAFAQGNGTVQFVGSTDQLIATSDAGGVERFYDVVVNKSGGILYNLCTEMNINNSMTFTSGVVDNNTGGTLLFDAGATTSGASNNSYVDGPVLKETDGSIGYTFTFPTGDAGIYGAIGIETTTNNADFYQATYFNAGYGNYVRNTADLSSVSTTEYWDLAPLLETGDEPRVTLHWGVHSNLSTTEAPLVAHFYTRAPSLTNQWEAEGLTPLLTGTLGVAGTVTSDPVTMFSPFTFAFPEVILNTDAVNLTVKEEYGKARLYWFTPATGGSTTYYVERSSNGIDFQTISKGIGSEQNTLNWLDVNTLNGSNYYRIKIVNKGVISYTPIRHLSIDKLKFNFSIYPNPASDYIALETQDSTQIESIQILTLLGQDITYHRSNSNNTRIDIEDLPNGIYLMKVKVKGATMKIKQFVKY